MKRRQTSYQTQFSLTLSQPQLKKRSKTFYASPISANINKLRSNPKNQYYSYQKLTLQSLTKNYPVSQLKPFSTFYSIQKIQSNIKNEQNFQRTSNLKHRNSDTLNKMLFKRINQTQSSNQSKNTTFYQAKIKFKKNKSKFNTAINFGHSITKDEQQNMVNEYFKQNHQILNRQKTFFQDVNSKIKDQFPLHFQPNVDHQQSKCRSKSCNEGFFKKKKLVFSKSFQKVRFKKSKQNKIFSQNRSFSIYSRSRNRVMNTQKITPSKKQFQTVESSIDHLSALQMSTSLQEKFKNQSDSFYKKYLRSSFQDKKKSLMQQLKIKF